MNALTTHVTQSNQGTTLRPPVDAPIHFGDVGGLHRFGCDHLPAETESALPALVRDSAASVDGVR